MLEQDGWSALKSGKAQAAIEIFEAAIKLDPKDAMLRLGAATAAFIARHDAVAKAHLEQALVLDPSLAAARVALAQVARRQGDFADAIRLYEIAAADAPGDADVRDTLDRWKRERELHDRMRLEVGDFFTVSFEGAEDSALAAQAVESLNRAYWRVCDLFGAYPPKSIPVVLYTGDQFQDIPRSPKWAAATFDGISASRCAAPASRARTWIACSRTNSPTRWSARWRPAACRRGSTRGSPLRSKATTSDGRRRE